MSDEEIVLKPTEDGIKAADDILSLIKGKSFSGRHPELGKMIKCQVCKLRHRASIKCTQTFAKDTEGNERSLERLVKPTARTILGAQVFKGKRIKPHLNKRAKEFVALVRTLVPDEYTQEELEKARNKAKRMLASKYGRHGFLPPIWQKFPKEKKEDVPETV